ncbi:MAG TPA: SxtJ family membrane protein [Vicinamibacterales bacterium]
MKWSDAVRQPSRRELRQFAVLWLLFFGGVGAWRAVTTTVSPLAGRLFILAGVVGLAGVAWPGFMRWIYTVWMIAVFPIGWVVSRIVIAALFFVLFTPIAFFFRAIGRDHLALKRRAGSHWQPRNQAKAAADYLRQS